MTPERAAKIERMKRLRQPDLGLVLENVNDPHNIYACLRSADAAGVGHVYIIHDSFALQWYESKRMSASAVKWLELHVFSDTQSCMEEVRKRYERLLGTYLGEASPSLYELDLSESTALIFGNESNGISERMRKYLDQNFCIPMMGMVQSLNISVACAVSLYEALRQRQLAGKYSEATHSERKNQR
jgi:tRNA (guanosine-2'-O-)-methyltransferase